MKLTIYLDKATADYYQQMAIVSGVPVRTLVRTTLQDVAMGDAKEAKGLLTDLLGDMAELIRRDL